ncbi:MAG: hypothetical protein CR993_08600 [Rhodobacterales bacterium]|nr:MAG: hypothetical protein CR993_08600 [Rhodobacterales bacterium]
MSAVFAILPVVLTLATGYFARRSGLIAKADWPAIESLSFRVLIPVMLVSVIAGTDLRDLAAGPYALALLSAVVAAGLVVLALSRPLFALGLKRPAFSTLFQTTTRWNGFISLALAEQYLPSEGMARIGIAFAILVVPINLVNVAILLVYGDGKASFRGFFAGIVKNPVVQGASIGLFLSLSGWTLPAPILGWLDLIGRAALGVGILAIGAGLSGRRLIHLRAPILGALALRPGLMLILFLAIGTAFGLSNPELLAGAFVLGVPAASIGFVMARKMGGDADLYADTITWQLLLSLVALPILARVLSSS